MAATSQTTTAGDPHTATSADTVSVSSAPSAVMPDHNPGSTPGSSLVGGTALSGGTAGGRAIFSTEELVMVMSHYDVGVIQGIKEFPRGSREAPKLLVRAEKGLYLLKRRARGKDDKYKVAFCHGIQLRLAEKQFPLPHLIGTRNDNNSMLRLGGTIYELFEYIKGNPYDQSLEATTDSGRVLSLFHKLLSDYDAKHQPPTGSYHDARSVHAAFAALPQTLAQIPSDHPAADPQQLASTIRELQERYLHAVEKVNKLGLTQWPKLVSHSDWHPGNMLFRGSRVVAVIDYDAARLLPRVLDAANGALQFSILGGTGDPTQWPEHLDESRFRRFVHGYDSVPDNMLTKAELAVIPRLMTQALIAEAVIPIAATGKFARMHGAPFLEMVKCKARWIEDHAKPLVKSVLS